MTSLVALPVALPLLAAAACALLPGALLVRRVLGLATTAAVLGLGGVLVAATGDGSVHAQQVGGWAGGVAIPLVADAFSALMLAVAALLVLTCLWFAAHSGEDRHPAFVPLVLALSAGVYAAFLTGDLFSLFVAIEVMLVPSYVLLALGGGSERVAATAVYLPVNLLASTVLLIGIGLVYGAAGTTNLAALHGAASDSGIALAGGVVLLSLAVKAAVVPAHGWLPRTYPHASPVVTALFSGLLTKVGVYAAFRVFAVLYGGDRAYEPVIAAVAVLTMVLGVLGAVGQGRIRDILTFHMVSQVGYIVMGLALFGVVGLSAAIFYLLQYVVVKASLFLTAAAVERSYGTGALDRLGGLGNRAPLLAVAFLLAALSLAGLPPFSGFVAKVVLVRAALLEESFVLAAVAVAVSLFTLLSMLKIWNGAFWGEPPPVPGSDTVPAAGPETGAEVGPDAQAHTATTSRTREAPRRTLVAPGLLLAVLSLVLGAAAGPLLAASTTAAEGLVDTDRYVQAVLSR